MRRFDWFPCFVSFMAGVIVMIFFMKWVEESWRESVPVATAIDLEIADEVNALLVRQLHECEAMALCADRYDYDCGAVADGGTR